MTYFGIEFRKLWCTCIFCAGCTWNAPWTSLCSSRWSGGEHIFRGARGRRKRACSFPFLASCFFSLSCIPLQLALYYTGTCQTRTLCSNTCYAGYPGPYIIIINLYHKPYKETKANLMLSVIQCCRKTDDMALIWLLFFVHLGFSCMVIVFCIYVPLYPDICTVFCTVCGRICHHFK